MSKKRQAIHVCKALPHDVTPMRHDFASGHEIPLHVHPEHQLVYASRGVMTIRADAGTWVVPPQRAVWIPARTPHRVTVHGAVSMRTLYFKARVVPFSRRCCVISVSPLLRELVLHACTFAKLEQRAKTDGHLIDLIVDQLRAVDVAPLHLVEPAEPRAAKVAELLSRDPGDARSLESICDAAGASKRTIERIFQSETQMSLGQWRQQLRLVRSLPLLAAGAPVSRVALDMGYSTPSAFIAMFRKALGTTPRRYFAE